MYGRTVRKSPGTPPKVGQTFGRLTIKRKVLLNRPGTWWECQCSCGLIVIQISSRLTSGNTRSCGCLRREVLSKLYSTHKDTKSREYSAWCSMIDRCCNEDSRAYPSYGGRGIVICKQWRHNYPRFLEDMGRRPGDGYTLERIDVNGNYEPSNCRWATWAEQNRNKRSNRKVTVRGVTKNLSDWSRLSENNINTIKDRLNRGWDVELAVFLPAQKRGFRVRKINQANVLCVVEKE